MNSADFAVKNHWYPFTIRLPVTELDPTWHRACVDVGSIRYEICPTFGELSVWKLHPESFNIEPRISTHEFFSEESFLRCCQWKGTFFFITRTGGLLKFNPSESVEQTVATFHKMNETVYRQLQQQFEASLQNASFFDTNDGENFWFLNGLGELLLMEEGRNDLKVMAKDANSAQLIDSSIAYISFMPSCIKLLHKKNVVFSTLVGFQDVRDYCIMPSLKCLWVNTGNTKTFRKGAPFLIPCCKPEDCVSEGGTAVLKTRLAIAERKLAGAEADRRRLLEELNTLNAQR